MRTFFGEHGCKVVGPVLIVLFAFSLVHLAGATQRLSGWMTFFGPTILMTVSLAEITFYISALHADPATMPYINLVPISAVQHLYFIVAAPRLFLPLGAGDGSAREGGVAWPVGFVADV